MIASPGIREGCRGALHAALDFVLPRACVSCERLLAPGDSGVVCGACWARLSLLPAPRCERCGHPLRPRGCKWCAALPPYVRAVRSVCWMPGTTAAAIVHALKYGGWTAAAVGMAERMARLTWPLDVVDERTALVPVPLARARERERGFNQSALIARGLSARWGVPVWDECLMRVRPTETQTRLTPDQRRRNVAAAFQATPARGALRGAHLVLVDDVLTTGATLAQCASVLFAGGARIISYVT
ncbi:MAG: ComF family protein, partial [Gemmatimonadota bacterium]|nr:ComF family protein [Gemmatimonadota bacterium]